ncbi:unnamed protein product [Cyprideis torosa]|uniref:Uncharacterized protein n=1 Tax=Cyprideis torosa TaxID=163714 RepID=A0A7R8ZKT8_9CRUS|nr:unnamed protein product [Cyprideis torosa]CAG0890139.1 unnamed protein product [Cyprideis torosa]
MGQPVSMICDDEKIALQEKLSEEEQVKLTEDRDTALADVYQEEVFDLQVSLVLNVFVNRHEINGPSKSIDHRLVASEKEDRAVSHQVFFGEFGIVHGSLDQIVQHISSLQNCSIPFALTSDLFDQVGIKHDRLFKHATRKHCHHFRRETEHQGQKKRIIPFVCSKSIRFLDEFLVRIFKNVEFSSEC